MQLSLRPSGSSRNQAQRAQRECRPPFNLLSAVARGGTVKNSAMLFYLVDARMQCTSHMSCPPPPSVDSLASNADLPCVTINLAKTGTTERRRARRILSTQVIPAPTRMIRRRCGRSRQSKIRMMAPSPRTKARCAYRRKPDQNNRSIRWFCSQLVVAILGWLHRRLRILFIRLSSTHTPANVPHKNQNLGTRARVKRCTPKTMLAPTTLSY